MQSSYYRLKVVYIITKIKPLPQSYTLDLEANAPACLETSTDQRRLAGYRCSPLRLPYTQNNGANHFQMLAQRRYAGVAGR